ncbi:hypothetical protein ACHQM5_029785 [Ranunculus cassubicifolius]
MGKLLCDSTTIQPSPQALPWKPPTTPPLDPIDIKTTWETVTGLEDQQKRYLQKLHSKGVLWKHPVRDSSPTRSTTIFRLSHGGDVDADGNCLFTASRKAMGLEMGARDLRKRTVSRFMADLESESSLERESNDAAIKHLYSPDLKVGWGIHVVQEVKLLAKKADRESLDVAIQDLLEVGLQRSICKIDFERCRPLETVRLCSRVIEGFTRFPTLLESLKTEFGRKSYGPNKISCQNSTILKIDMGTDYAISDPNPSHFVPYIGQNHKDIAYRINIGTIKGYDPVGVWSGKNLFPKETAIYQDIYQDIKI